MLRVQPVSGNSNCMHLAYQSTKPILSSVTVTPYLNQQLTYRSQAPTQPRCHAHNVCRTKSTLPLVSPNQAKARTPEGAADQADTASARIASSSHPFFASLSLLQDSYCVATPDWYSLVATLLSSHWDSISSSAAQQGGGQVGSQGGPQGNEWMCWAWLQDMFRGLHPEQRQVTCYSHSSI